MVFSNKNSNMLPARAESKLTAIPAQGDMQTGKPKQEERKSPVGIQEVVQGYFQEEKRISQSSWWWVELLIYILIILLVLSFFSNFNIVEKMLLIFHHQGEHSKRNGKIFKYLSMRRKPPMAQVVCKRFHSPHSKIDIWVGWE